ncbi:MAG: hypothetical protein AUK31_02080 [Fibrobacteres bacterium CG2_30_45_31]|nr:MAG: hypothetical protein AUK31_02080 [Fibrobacteres bacterium CG2_30_45_31]
MSRIFIVLATYNGERFLSAFLDSLLKLTRQADSIIVIDDESKDTTVSILKSYEGKRPLQIFCEEKNQGHRAAFAKGLEMAHKQAHIGNADLVFGDAEVIDSGGETIAESWREEGNILSHLTTETLLTGFTYPDAGIHFIFKEMNFGFAIACNHAMKQLQNNGGHL